MGGGRSLLVPCIQNGMKKKLKPLKKTSSHHRRKKEGISGARKRAYDNVSG
jgi:hypothetical protein